MLTELVDLGRRAVDAFERFVRVHEQRQHDQSAMLAGFVEQAQAFLKRQMEPPPAPPMPQFEVSPPVEHYMCRRKGVVWMMAMGAEVVACPACGQQRAAGGRLDNDHVEVN